jgi:hypothetical protein
MADHFKAERLIVLWHCAILGGCFQIAEEQLAALAACGLTSVLCTHLGPGLAQVQETAARKGIQLIVMDSDPNVDHYETRAMETIEKLARWHQGAFLYLHTKGASAPFDEDKARWRRLMQRELVDNWRLHLPRLADHDVIGVDWISWPPHPHFSGNFWLARADWIRKLPSFSSWHRSLGFVRFSCEFWIGAAPTPRVGSLFCRDLQWPQMLALERDRNKG